MSVSNEFVVTNLELDPNLAAHAAIQILHPPPPLQEEQRRSDICPKALSLPRACGEWLSFDRMQIGFSPSVLHSSARRRGKRRHAQNMEHSSQKSVSMQQPFHTLRFYFGSCFCRDNVLISGLICRFSDIILRFLGQAGRLQISIFRKRKT